MSKDLGLVQTDDFINKIDASIKRNTYSPSLGISFDSSMHRFFVFICYILCICMFIASIIIFFVSIITLPTYVAYFSGRLYDIINGTSHCVKYWDKLVFPVIRDIDDPFRDRSEPCWNNVSIALNYGITLIILWTICWLCILYIRHGPKMDVSLEKKE